MDSGGWNWAILDIVGPAILVIVLLWAVLRNRASRRSRNETERGTREVYREEEERRRSGDDGRA
jgi:predicted MFS family arabinose efflux permease